MSNWDDDVTQMVLLSYSDYERLKKNNDLYVELCKQKKSISESKTPSSDVLAVETEHVQNKEGHGENLDDSVKDFDKDNSYITGVAKELPNKYIQPNNEYEKIDLDRNLTSLVPKHKKDKATKLLEELMGKKNLSWDSDNQLIIKEQKIQGSDLKKLIEKVFRGIRRNDYIGEKTFMDYLAEENLAHYIESVEPDWYYIGKP